MDKLYTIIEVATKLGISDKTLRRWEDAGRFTPSRTLGNQRRYSLEDLQILDAIKHGIFESQKDLLTIEQAARIAGVTPTTIIRWEDAGKIHPFITSGNTYYPRTKLVEKMEELKKIYSPVVEEIVEPPIDKPIFSHPVSRPPDPVRQLPPIEAEPPRLSTLNVSKSTLAPPHQPINLRNAILNSLITIILILSYHFFFNTSLQNPQSPKGAVQGITAPDPRLDLLDKYFSKPGTILTSALSLIPSSAPLTSDPGTIYFDADSSSLKIYKNGSWGDLSSSQNITLSNGELVSGQSVISKDKDQVSVTNSAITKDSVVTITFHNDYAPAKKYWVTIKDGSFTLHTDFALSQDSKFSYYLIQKN